MWRETEAQYRAAAEAYIKAKTGSDVTGQDKWQERARFLPRAAQSF